MDLTLGRPGRAALFTVLVIDVVAVTAFAVAAVVLIVSGLDAPFFDSARVLIECALVGYASWILACVAVRGLIRTSVQAVARRRLWAGFAIHALGCAVIAVTTVWGAWPHASLPVGIALGAFAVGGVILTALYLRIVSSARWDAA